MFNKIINHKKQIIMRRLIFTIGIMLIATVFTLAQTTITVSGTVTSSNTSAAVPNHQVNILIQDSMSSFYFYQSVNTNANGAYSVTVQNYPSYALIQVTTVDCNNQTQYQNIWSSPYVANFSICTGTTPPNCQAAYTAFPDSTNPLTIHFMDQTVGNPTSWLWSFGDNTTSTLANPTHTYAQSGIYVVTLSVYCSNTQSSFTDTIFISGGPSGCQAAFTSYPDSTNPSLIYFYNQSTGNPTSYSWDFGDNTTSTLQHPSHNYAQAGTYTVTLAISGSGCQSSTSNSVTIGGGSSNGIIYGQISAGSNFADFGLVYLIDFNPSTNLLTAVDTTTIDSSGYYGFTNVSYGTYYVKAALSANSSYYNSYFPTYYGNQLLWSNATTVSLNSSSASANISLIAGNNPGGPGFIGGNVLQGANKGPGDPIENVKIMLLDMSDNPIAIDITDANGDYGFSNIAYGTYKVWIDLPGKTTTPAQVTISAANPSSNNNNIVINSTTIVAGVTNSPSMFDANMSKVYPNPTFENSKIEITLTEASQINVSIFNAVGQLVKSNTLELLSGKSVINIPSSELDNGIYTIIIEANMGQVYRKLVKVTK